MPGAGLAVVAGDVALPFYPSVSAVRPGVEFNADYSDSRRREGEDRG